MKKLRPWIFAVALVLPVIASAQKSGGRTDGPEGSEIGYGGYTRVGGSGNFSLQLDFGAGFPASRVPLLFGGTGSFWVDDWFVVDATAHHVLQNKTIIQVGPRFRTPTYPVSAHLGVKAGPVIYPGVVAFALSPQLGADIVLSEHILMGLNYNLDLAFLSSVVDVSHRVYMSLGYRF
jgi:hypothetical protein